MVGICFLSIAYTQKEKGHVAVDFFTLKLSGKPLQAVEMASSLMSIIISFLLFYRSAVEARIAVDVNLVTSGIVSWPAWPLKIIVAFGFLMLTIRIAIQVKQQVRSIIQGEKQ
jgi:TRAP-type C4-dicarboxylate transport system permease small subunit